MFISSEQISNFSLLFIILFSINSFAADRCDFVVGIKEGYELRPIAIYDSGEFHDIYMKQKISDMKYLLELKSSIIFDSMIHIYQELDADDFEMEIEILSEGGTRKCPNNITEITPAPDKVLGFIDWVISKESLIKYEFNKNLDLITNFSLFKITDLNKDSKLEFWVTYLGLYRHKMYGLFEEVAPNEYALRSAFCDSCN